MDGQKLSLHNPDRNFVILEQSADELVVKETDTGIYYAFKRLN